MSSIDSSTTAEINVFIVHAKHEYLSLHKPILSAKSGCSVSEEQTRG